MPETFINKQTSGGGSQGLPGHFVRQRRTCSSRDQIEAKIMPVPPYTLSVHCTVRFRAMGGHCTEQTIHSSLQVQHPPTDTWVMDHAHILQVLRPVRHAYRGPTIESKLRTREPMAFEAEKTIIRRNGADSYGHLGSKLKHDAAELNMCCFPDGCISDHSSALCGSHAWSFVLSSAPPIVL